MQITSTNSNAVLPTVSALPTVPDVDRTTQAVVASHSQAALPIEPSPSLADSWRPHLFNRRTKTLAGAAIALVGGNLVQLANQPAQYEGKFQLLVEPIADRSSDPAALKTAAQATQTMPSIDYATQMQVLWSPKLLAPVVQQLGTQYADLTYDTLAQKLEIAHRDGAKTLEITYQDTDPKKVQAILADVSHAYLQYSQSCRTTLCRELQFVERRLPQLQKQVAIAQRNLQTLQQQHGITEPNALGQQLSQRYSALTQQRQDLQIRLTDAQTQLAIIQKRSGQAERGFLEQALNRNDRYQALQQQLQAIANQLTVELARPQPDRATLQPLKQRYQLLAAQMTQAAQQPIASQLAQAIADFQAEKTTDYTAVVQQQTRLEWVTAAAQVQVLALSTQAIAQTEGQIQQQIQQWAVLARQYAALNLELTLATDNLNLYTAKRTALQQIMQPQTHWQLTSAPTVEPVSSSFVISDSEQRFSLGLLLSFMLVVLVMSIAEQTKPKKPMQRPLPPMQPEYSWQTASWQTASWQIAAGETIPCEAALGTSPPFLLPAAAALTARSLQHQRTTLFLLTATVRLEAIRTKFSA